jgi:DNA-binding LytR/AlgR family response regulator
VKILGIKINGRKGDDSDFQLFDLEEVNYIDLYRPRTSADQIPVYHTSHGEYAPVMTLKDLSIALRTYGFVRMDKSTIVNKSRILNKKYIGTETVITFVDFCEISISRRSRIE